MAHADSDETKINNQKIKYDNKLMKLMSFFEAMTKARLKDCFVDKNNVLTFVVEPADYGLAVGRGGSTVKRLEAALKRKIKVVEYSGDIASFVAGLVQPLKVKSVAVADGVVTIVPESASRGYLIGRGGKNLRNYEAILQRYFTVKELKVL